MRVRMNPYTRDEKYPPFPHQKQILDWGVSPVGLLHLSFVPGEPGCEEKEATMTEDTARNRRDWFKIALLALLPALALGLVALGGKWRGADGAEATSGTSTTIAATETSTTQDEPAANQPVEDSEQTEQDETEPESPEPAQPVEPEDPPTPAQLEVPASVTVGAGGVAHIEIGNSGELSLDIFEVDTNGFPLTVGDIPGEIAGGTTETLTIEVDTSDLDEGPYTMTVGLATSGGVADVDIEGTKLGLVFIPPTSDIDVATNYIVPHGVNSVDVKMVNNEDENVTVELGSDDDRLTFPATVELAPGENEVTVLISPLAVAWNVIDVLHMNVSESGTELATVTITKHGA